MIIRKPHFVSVCLLSLASSIALTEYVMYSPSSVSFDRLNQGESLEDSEEETAEGYAKDDDGGGASNKSAISSALEALEKQFRTLTGLGDKEETQISNDEESSESVVEEDKAKPVVQSKNDLLLKGNVTVTVGTGDTLASILTGLGLRKADVYAACDSLASVFNLKNLKIGQEIIVKSHNESDGIILDSIEVKDEYLNKFISSREQNGKFKTQKIEIPTKKVMKTVSGTIDSKNPVSGLVKNGVKKKIASEALKTVSNVVNIYASKEPVNYEFLYKETYDDVGRTVSSPELMYASVLVHGQIYRVYKFKDGNNSEYVDTNGVRLNSLGKANSMLGPPLSMMKINSSFGYRFHPTMRRRHMHTGVDLKANVGTPVYAAAAGIVSKALYYAGYGKYVRLNHLNGIQTAYGHLSRMAVRAGQRVRKGQVIGYSGCSGRTTGAHLHYELIKNERFINPLSFIKQEPQKLAGIQLVKFNKLKKQVNLQVVGLTPVSSSANGKSKKAAIKKYL